MSNLSKSLSLTRCISSSTDATKTRARWWTVTLWGLKFLSLSSKKPLVAHVPSASRVALSVHSLPLPLPVTETSATASGSVNATL